MTALNLGVHRFGGGVGWGVESEEGSSMSTPAFSRPKGVAPQLGLQVEETHMDTQR